MSYKTIYLDSYCELDLAAVVEDGKICDFAIEKRRAEDLVGNVYKGRVNNLLNGMQAAFIDCGLQRNCYISAECLYPDRNGYDGNEIDIPSQLNLRVGDEILVQVTKPPVGNKGAKVTTCLSFVGKSVIYMPETPFIGVSHKIEDKELRRNMTFLAEKLKKGNEGLIMRTAAPYASTAQISEELTFHRNVYADIKSKFKNAPVGALLHTAAPLPLRILRDTPSHEIDKVYTGNKQLGEYIKSYMKMYPTRSRRPVVVSQSMGDLFYEQGLIDEISAIRSPRVEFENGAYLIIERTEALTVIDVNTGKFTGGDSLEQTVYQTNIAAAREIARQVRLRNIGGIVVVDFIDMQNENHRTSLTAELEKALASDKVKCHVLPMSEFGLIQFTRKRSGKSVCDVLTQPCKSCKGAGYTRTTASILLEIRARLLEILNQGYKAVCIDLNYDVGNILIEWREYVLDIATRFPQARVYLILHRTYREDTFNLRYDNSPTITLPEGYVLLY